eukprot:CAMPEP_0168394786 /NCGR_PEP_ID=MMETSP0228-20121227/19713_1 /TAXON_ID=133427 /ORGANISM="Protoceratium reticulatum, Strain CCCM 535 (=CCMP 1889)" /LENGTH=616 /DNA_ID=CAMNT_0008408209 /DNA_START=233 /DNA_END=2083 /DNA_ORIENTATION=+
MSGLRDKDPDDLEIMRDAYTERRKTEKQTLEQKLHKLQSKHKTRRELSSQEIKASLLEPAITQEFQTEDGQDFDAARQNAEDIECGYGGPTRRRVENATAKFQAIAEGVLGVKSGEIVITTSSRVEFECMQLFPKVTLNQNDSFCDDMCDNFGSTAQGLSPTDDVKPMLALQMKVKFIAAEIRTCEDMVNPLIELAQTRKELEDGLLDARVEVEEFTESHQTLTALLAAQNKNISALIDEFMRVNASLANATAEEKQLGAQLAQLNKLKEVIVRLEDDIANVSIRLTEAMGIRTNLLNLMQAVSGLVSGMYVLSFDAVPSVLHSVGIADNNADFWAYFFQECTRNSDMDWSECVNVEKLVSSMAEVQSLCQNEFMPAVRNHTKSKNEAAAFEELCKDVFPQQMANEIGHSVYVRATGEIELLEGLRESWKHTFSQHLASSLTAVPVDDLTKKVFGDEPLFKEYVSKWGPNQKYAQLLDTWNRTRFRLDAASSTLKGELEGMTKRQDVENMIRSFNVNLQAVTQRKSTLKDDKEATERLQNAANVKLDEYQRQVLDLEISLEQASKEVQEADKAATRAKEDMTEALNNGSLMWLNSLLEMFAKPQGFQAGRVQRHLA